MDWYKTPEIPLNAFLEAIRPVYEAKNIKQRSGTEDVFLRSMIGMDDDAWNERVQWERQKKALTMSMGYFHQRLLGSFEGWKCLKNGHATGCDVSNQTETEFWEVKNADNTMNSDSSKSVIRKLLHIASAGHKACLVLVNCSKQTVPRFQAPESIEVISGCTAYARLSGRASFFDDLAQTIQECMRRFPTLDLLVAEVAARTSQ